MNNSIDSTALLSQLKIMAGKAGIPPAEVQEATHNRTGFTELLRNSVQSVNERKESAAELAKAFELGDPSVDLSQVTIEIQKARIAFEALSQVRNKVISAYKEIMNMPL
ncbi:MAG: flagellar hook-basal body complex protein FliE [Gammaproteobacteria bacterium]|nr:flagellar hook-basal body complex protein FliE [Gammaproteobacteria bacterium]